MERTRDNEGMILNVALSYSGRTDLSDAVRGLAEEVKAGELPR